MSYLDCRWITFSDCGDLQTARTDCLNLCSDYLSTCETKRTFDVLAGTILKIVEVGSRVAGNLAPQVPVQFGKS